RPRYLRGRRRGVAARRGCAMMRTYRLYPKSRPATPRHEQRSTFRAHNRDRRPFVSWARGRRANDLAHTRREHPGMTRPIPFALTDIGLVRTTNQDAAFAAAHEDVAVAAVADGMGGMPFG